MADGRRRDEWKRTARLCSVLANCHRNPDKRPAPFVDADFSIFQDEQQPRPPKASITVLKTIFVSPDSETQTWPPQTSVPVPHISN